MKIIYLKKTAHKIKFFHWKTSFSYKNVSSFLQQLYKINVAFHLVVLILPQPFFIYNFFLLLGIFIYVYFHNNIQVWQEKVIQLLLFSSQKWCFFCNISFAIALPKKGHCYFVVLLFFMLTFQRVYCYSVFLALFPVSVLVIFLFV